MSDRPVNERLFGKATKENLLDCGEPEITESAPAASGKQPLSSLIPGASIAIAIAFDLIALLVALTVNVIAGVVMLGIASWIYALWLILRLRRIKRSRSAPSTRE